MRYLLDTSVVVALLRNRPDWVRERLRRAVDTGGVLAISSVVLFELWYGVARSGRRRENAARLRAFLGGDITVLPFDDGDAARAGELRAELDVGGKPIGPYDLLIAAQALRRGITLVTANTSEFGRVDGLAVEDWTTQR